LELENEKNYQENFFLKYYAILFIVFTGYLFLFGKLVNSVYAGCPSGQSCVGETRYDLPTGGNTNKVLNCR